MIQMLSLFIMLVLSVSATEVAAHTVFTRMSDRQSLTLTEVADVAAKADVVLVGESHDSKEHHDLQLALIRALQSKVPIAIGMEMMQADYQKELDEWTAGRMPESTMQAVFQQNWSDWYLYRDIFIFARDNHIPMVALNVPLDIVRKVSAHGFASLTAEERKGLPEGTRCDLTNPQIAVLKKTFRSIAAHLGNGKLFNNFCEAQTVRNSGMAASLERYIKTHPGRKVVFLTGIWHAVKYAVPDQLQRNGSKLSYTVILPETPEISTENAGSDETDFLVEL